MAFALRDRRKQQDESANYERENPDREVYIRQAGYSQQDYMNGGYNNYTYNQGYNQDYQYQGQPQYNGYFQMDLALRNTTMTIIMSAAKNSTNRICSSIKTTIAALRQKR